ncbi:MAG: HAMP domain-containing histidine kinase [Coriobacteriales bacterium]|jgi:two-component system OmpR family sensor kinase|nr:HAMP domain-containing histidine kinase [Coriobacteriales bacterium]
MQYRTIRILLAAVSALCTLLFALLLTFVILIDPRITEWLLLIALPFAALAFFGAHVLSGILLFPLGQIVRKTKQLASGDLTVKFGDDHPAFTPRVVRELGQSLDKVSARVRSSIAEVSAEGKRQGQFISDVSHEIRTPLTAIRGAAETLMDEDIPYEDRQRFCQTIVRESERLTRLANDLITLQRIEGDGEVKLKRVNLHHIVEYAVDMLEPLFEEREVDLTVSGEAPDVLGDPDRLQQVVQNLMENASRFVGSGGRVHVELSGIREHSVITVSDDGPGFGDIDPARLFDRFYRGDSSRARTTGGIGLGLTIVKAIVSAHEGTVEAVNLPGGGACFIVAIPSLPPHEG